jgi:hypothetical protein
MTTISELNRCFDAMLEDDNEDEDEEDDKTDVEKDDEREKGGGKRKRRSAYPSGRKEKLGLTNGQVYDSPDTGSSKSDRDNNKRSLSRTSGASNHRWRKR